MKPVTRYLLSLAAWLSVGLAVSVYEMIDPNNIAWWPLMGLPAALLLVVLVAGFVGSIAALIVAITHQPPRKPMR